MGPWVSARFPFQGCPPSPGLAQSFAPLAISLGTLPVLPGPSSVHSHSEVRPRSSPRGGPGWLWGRGRNSALFRTQGESFPPRLPPGQFLPCGVGSRRKGDGDTCARYSGQTSLVP